MRLFSRGPAQRLFRWAVFVAVMAGAWWGFGTYLSAAKALEILMQDLNTP